MESCQFELPAGRNRHSKRQHKAERWPFSRIRRKSHTTLSINASTVQLLVAMIILFFHHSIAPCPHHFWTPRVAVKSWFCSLLYSGSLTQLQASVWKNLMVCLQIIHEHLQECAIKVIVLLLRNMAVYDSCLFLFLCLLGGRVGEY